jgi:hypothetical protein
MGGTRDFTPYVSKALISHKLYTEDASLDVGEVHESADKHYNKCLIVSLGHTID